MEQTGCSKTSAYKIQTPGNYPEENIQHAEHGKSLKSRIYFLLFSFFFFGWGFPFHWIPLLILHPCPSLWTSFFKFFLCVTSEIQQVIVFMYGMETVMDYLKIRHQFLLLLVEHRASMKSFQALQSPAIPLTSFHDLPVFLISSSAVLRHVLFGLPLLLYPWGFQSNAVFSIAPTSLRNVCPFQFHFLLFIWNSIGFCLVIIHSSSFVILWVHFILTL